MFVPPASRISVGADAAFRAQGAFGNTRSRKASNCDVIGCTPLR